MYRAVRTASKTCNRLCSLPKVSKRSFALVYSIFVRFNCRNDYSVRKRMTIGLSGFAVVATGTYIGCRSLYRNRKAKKIAHAASIAAAKEEEQMVVENVKPVIDVIPTVEKEEEEVAPEVIVEEKEEETVEVVEKTVVEEKEVEEVAEEKAEEVVEEEKAVEDAVEEVKGEEIVEEVDEPEEDDKYHPWWEGVKEISLYLPTDDIEKLTTLFPTTCKHKYAFYSLFSYNY